jgi:hypothetical protein
MAKKKSRIEEINEKLLEHVEAMENLFPPELQMNINVIGRDEQGVGCEFIIGRDGPSELLGVIERTLKRVSAPNKASGLKKKAAPRSTKKTKK